MTTPHLETLKRITTWGGACTTFAGIILSISTGGSVAAACLAMFGLLLTCCGHWVSGALAKRQAREKQADERRIEELKEQIAKVRSHVESHDTAATLAILNAI